MTNAHVLTIGTEITSGEVVNSNAAWLSQQLEALGVRVHSHLTVRDQREEYLSALKWPGYTPTAGAENEPSLIFVAGGLGPTSDDMTRACVAEHLGLKLEFDEQVWRDLNALYQKRGLPIREAHKHQCWFPVGSERLRNPTGTALGFYSFAHRSPNSSRAAHYFVLPGPPRELEGMYKEEVLPRLQRIVPRSDLKWHRWTVFAVPESEVAELVEPEIANSKLEVGYRAHYPYIKVKLYANSDRDQKVTERVSHVLAPSLVSHTIDQTPGLSHDLAEQLISLWPDAQLNILDEVSEGVLAQRLFGARRILNSSIPIQIQAGGLSLFSVGEGFKVEIENSKVKKSIEQKLPFKVPLDSDRGRKAAAEWALWLAVRSLSPR